MAWFSPTRLRIARQRRALSKKALAEALRLSPTSLNNYEEGKRIPPAEVVSQFVFALQFPHGFFFASEVDGLEPEFVTFRSRRALTATSRDRTVASGQIVSEILSPSFRKRFRLPTPDLPDLSRETPEMAARILRTQWGLGQAPIGNLVHLLESRGVDLFWLSDDSPCLDAVSFWRGSQPFVALNLGKSGERGRFDAAHELGHLVLHRQANETDQQGIEDQANQFASAFLLPAEQFRLECPRRLVLQDLLPLKERWKVSLASIVVRGHELGIFGDRSYQYAFQQISQRGWRKEEPHPISREASTIQAQIYTKLAAKGVTPAEFCGELNLPWSDVLELTPEAVRLDVAPARTRPTRAMPPHLQVVRGGASE